MSGLCEPAGAVQDLPDRGWDRILPNHPPLCLKKSGGRRQTLGTYSVAPAAGGTIKRRLRMLPENTVGRAVLNKKGADILTGSAVGTKIHKIVHE